MDSYPSADAKLVLGLLKRYRLDEKFRKERKDFEFGSDFGYDENILFRVRLADSETSTFNRAGVFYPLSLEDLKRDHEIRMAEIKELKGFQRC